MYKGGLDGGCTFKTLSILHDMGKFMYHNSPSITI